ncbi:hypothetical protein CRYUN_Cryun08bG0136500 [Craigia yunnanensis]
MEHLIYCFFHHFSWTHLNIKMSLSILSPADAFIDNLNGSIDEPVEDGDTALHLACLYGFLPCVQLLLERGANFEAKDEDGAVPLHDACAGGGTNGVCLKRMLDSVDAEARGEHVDVIWLLLANGASPTNTNTYGKVLHELADPEQRFGEFLKLPLALRPTSKSTPDGSSILLLGQC